MDITASILVEPIQRNYSCNILVILSFEALEKNQEGIKFQNQNMIRKELHEIYKMDITALILVQPIQRNYICNILIFLSFEVLDKYQEGIIFQIQIMILKELDEIYKMDITASILVQPIQRNYICNILIILSFEALQKFQEGIKF